VFVGPGVGATDFQTDEFLEFSIGELVAKVMGALHDDKEAARGGGGSGEEGIQHAVAALDEGVVVDAGAAGGFFHCHGESEGHSIGDNAEETGLVGGFGNLGGGVVENPPPGRGVQITVGKIKGGFAQGLGGLMHVGFDPVRIPGVEEFFEGLVGFFFGTVRDKVLLDSGDRFSIDHGFGGRGRGCSRRGRWGFHYFGGLCRGRRGLGGRHHRSRRGHRRNVGWCWNGCGGRGHRRCWCGRTWGGRCGCTRGGSSGGWGRWGDRRWNG